MEIFLETLTDSLKTLPFLFLAYLIIEYLEHKAGGKFEAFLKSKGRFAPVLGGGIGLIPQCGFSVAAANLYAGGIISAGTLCAVFLSTSDEALPVLLAKGADALLMIKLIAAKFLIAIIAGMLIDLLFRRMNMAKKYDPKNQVLCKDCHCDEESIIISAVKHTAQIFFFIFILTIILNFIVAYMGEGVLSSLLAGESIFQPFLIALIGLIPNCAPSVLIAELYMGGTLKFGSALAGLLSGSGMGVAVLFKVNNDKKQNLMIIGLIYIIGALFGIALNFIGI